MSQSTPTEHEIDVYASEFVLTGDKSKAWKKAFPKSQAKQEVIWSNAQKMHNRGQVLDRIDQKRTEIAQGDGKDFDISYEAQVKRCLNIHNLGISPKHDQQGNEIAQNLAAAQSALNELNKMAGHNDKSSMSLVKFKFNPKKNHSEQCTDIINAAASGTISVDVANMFISAIKASADIEEATVLKERIAALEALVS